MLVGGCVVTVVGGWVVTVVGGCVVTVVGGKVVEEGGDVEGGGCVRVVGGWVGFVVVTGLVVEVEDGAMDVVVVPSRSLAKRSNSSGFKGVETGRIGSGGLVVIVLHFSSIRIAGWSEIIKIRLAVNPNPRPAPSRSDPIIILRRIMLCYSHLRLAMVPTPHYRLNAFSKKY